MSHPPRILRRGLRIFVLSLLAIAIPVSFHLGRTAAPAPGPMPMTCLVDFPIGTTLTPMSYGDGRLLLCHAAPGGGFLCKDAPPVTQ